MLKIRALAMVVIIFLIPVASHAEVMLDRVIAIVNQEIVTWSELYQLIQDDSTMKTASLGEAEKARLVKEREAIFLETLVNMKLQVQEAEKLNFRVTDEELNEAIEGIKKKYSMSEAVLREAIRKDGFTFDQYRKRLKEQILINKVIGNQVRSKIIISDDDVRKYLNENKGAGEVVEGYRISQIFFKLPHNIDEKNQLDEKVKTVLGKIQAGEKFSDLARQYSEDPYKNDGGDLGFVKPEVLAVEFKETLSTLKTGETSKPFATIRGVHIVRLDEKVDSTDQNVVKEEVRRVLWEKVFNERYQLWIKGLREKSFIDLRL